MKKVDLKKELKHLYRPSAKEPSVVDVSPMSFLMVDGAGDPNSSQEYQEAVSALYSVAYSLKFMVKKGEAAADYGVMPLEGVWWADDARFDLEDKDTWLWTAMIMQPEYVTQALFEEALVQVEKKKDPAALSRVRFESFHEGLSAQIMHIGPYADEEPTVERLHSFIGENGYQLRGRHHEIYLSDPNRTAPDRLKTVIRQPITG